MNNFRSPLCYRDPKSRGVRENRSEDFSHGTTEVRSRDHSSLCHAIRRTKVSAGLIATRSDNSSRDLERVFSVILARSTLFTAGKRILRVHRVISPQENAKGAEEKGGQKRERESLSQGSDYSVQQVQTWPGVADTAIYVRVYTVDG